MNEEMKVLDEVVNWLREIIDKKMNKILGENYDLLIYGSAVNGLFESGCSDIDISLFVEPPVDCEYIECFLSKIDHKKIRDYLYNIIPASSYNMKVTDKERIDMSAGHLL